MRLTVSVPERATHVSLYAPGRRTVAGRRSLTTFAPALTRSRHVWRRRFFASRSVAVTCAGLETLIRTAIVVVFFSAIRFAPATEKASRVCGAAVPSGDDEVDRARREREPGGGGLDDGARGARSQRPR